MMLYICLTFLLCRIKGDDDDDAITIGVWEGFGGGGGGLQPHQFLETQIFGGSKRNLGKVSF